MATDRSVPQGRPARDQALARRRYAHSVHVDVARPEPRHRLLVPLPRRLVRLARRPARGPRPRPAARPGAGLRFADRELPGPPERATGPPIRALADEDIDLVLHLGDYIYEYDPSSSFADRRHTTPQTAGPGPAPDARRLPGPARPVQARPGPAGGPCGGALDRRLGRPRGREQLRRPSSTRSTTPAPPGRTPAAFAAERAAGYQAYWEHLPIRPRPSPGSPDLQALPGRSTTATWCGSQRAGHPAVPHRPARRLPQRLRPGGRRPGATSPGRSPAPQQEAWLVGRLASTSRARGTSWRSR